MTDRARLGYIATASVATVTALGFLLAGCGANTSTGAGTAATSASSSSMAGMSMGAGDSMAPGESMAPAAATSIPAAATSAASTASAASGAPSSGSPSKTALMVCGDDIKGKVRSVLKLAKPAPVKSTFKDRLFTCTYLLPQGPLVLSVKQSPTDAAAGTYFDAVRKTLAPTHNVIGLGTRAYATNTGIAVVIKDNQTLRVDATGLPAVFGSEHQKRTDLAYEIASDVLGCWTGDGDE